MTAYPQSLPLECISAVVSMVRNREVAEKKAEFAHCVWEIQGFAQKSLLGEGEHNFGDAGPWSEAELTECATALKDFQDEPPTFGATEEEAIDPATLMILVQLAIKLITALANRRKN